MKNRVKAFSITIDPLTMSEAVTVMTEWLQSKDHCRYVVTPNVDHVVQLQNNTSFREAYSKASLVLTDGKPVRFALNLLKRPVPETIPGSDLPKNIFTHWDASCGKLKVFLLGAAPGVAEKAARNIISKWPSVEVVGTHSPPFGFEKNQEENQHIIDKIAACQPNLLIIGLGAPKQELWIYKHHKQIQAGVALCVGATIDFLAGEQRRAPRWMQRLALEWLYRMLTNPGRLVKRYVMDALQFPNIVWREMQREKKNKNLPAKKGQ